MKTDEILKEMDVLEERAQILREEIVAEEDYLAAKPKLDELEEISNRMFELHKIHQATLLDDLLLKNLRTISGSKQSLFFYLLDAIQTSPVMEEVTERDDLYV